MMTEAAATAAQSATEKPTASIQSAALDKKWVTVWGKMLFKDMVGWPLWETEMHDILKAAFPELQARYLVITPRG